MGEDPLFSNVRENLMKKLLLAMVTALLLPMSVAAIELGSTGITLNNSVEATWSIDNEDYDLTAESGITVPVWVMSASVDADWDLEAMIKDEGGDLYKGIDIGLDYSLTSFLMLELDTGINNDWEREDIKLSATVSF
tara:strand:- start:2570 stop:2980 length:411 start_codon:yes stop_codon:yes gene_type:complete